MPGDLSELQDRLRAAYADVAATVRPEDISERAPEATSRVRWRAAARTGSRRSAALAAAAAVLLIVVTATVIPHVLQSGSRHRSGSGAAAHVPRSHMAYVVTQRDQLIPVDLAAGTALTPIPLGVAGADTGVAISPDGRLVYVLTARGQLVPVDVRTGTAARPIDVGGVTQGLVMTPNGKAAYVLEPPYGVVAVDLATRTALGLIKVHDADGFALTPDGKTLYVLGSANGTTGPVLTVINTATNVTIGALALTGPGYVSQKSVTMAPDGKTVYVTYEWVNGRTSQTSGSIIGVDVASNTELKPISVGGRDVWTGNALDFAISPDSQTGYLAGLHSVIPVDLRTGATLPSITPPASNVDSSYSLTLSPDGRRLYIIQNIGSMVVPVDTATGTELPPIRLAGRWGLDDGIFAQGGKTFYVLSYGAAKGAVVPGRMTPIDVATGTVGKSVDFPAGLDGIVLSPGAGSASFLP